MQDIELTLNNGSKTLVNSYTLLKFFFKYFRLQLCVLLTTIKHVLNSTSQRVLFAECSQTRIFTHTQICMILSRKLYKKPKSHIIQTYNHFINHYARSFFLRISYKNNKTCIQQVQKNVRAVILRT